MNRAASDGGATAPTGPDPAPSGAPPAARTGAGPAARPARPAPDRTMALWMALGTLGALGLAVAGTRLGAVLAGRSFWWFNLAGGPVSPGLTAAFYGALAVLTVAWVGVGVGARRGRLGVRRCWLVLALWGIPLFLGPPLFSRDLYSYVAQGLLAHHGLNPYTHSPSDLGPGPLLSSVAGPWRTTTSPYGPLFVEASRLVAGVGGSLTLRLLAFRALELVGVVLLMTGLPRLARLLGTDPGTALWLGALSPLALFSFVASGHNDALMVGLAVWGVVLAKEGRFATALVLCSLAATVKLPALAAAVFVAVEHFEVSPPQARRRVVAQAVLVPVATVAAVTLLTGFGWGWLGPKALKIPTELRTVATPAVSVGVLAFHVVRLLRVPVSQHTTVSVVQLVCELAALAALVALALAVRRHEAVRLLGVGLLVLVLAGPTLWPWYLTWGLVFLAATPAQRSRVLAALGALAMLEVGVSGHPLLGGSDYLGVAALVVVAAAWLLAGGRWRAALLGPVVRPAEARAARTSGAPGGGPVTPAR